MGCGSVEFAATLLNRNASHFCINLFVKLTKHNGE